MPILRPRPARTIAATLLALVLAITTFAAIAPERAGAATVSNDEARMLQLLNNRRAAAGVAPVKMHAFMSDKSREWAQAMGSRNKLEHQSAGYGYSPSYVETTCAKADPNWMTCAENVGMTAYKSNGAHAEDLDTAFYNSQGHRANMLDPRHNQVGIGIAYAHGKTWVTVRFMQGADYVASSSTERFVRASYIIFTGGTPSSATVNTWTNRLVSGSYSRSQFTHSLATSDAWLKNELDKLYQGAFGRNIDSGGQSYWSDYVRRGGRLTDVGVYVYASKEFYQRNGSTNRGFVAGLYKKILHRNPDSSGLNYWTNQINRGMARDVAARNFYNSVESRTKRVNGLYRDLLGRNADSGGLKYWRDQLLHLDDVRLAENLAVSQEFFTRAQRIGA